jgi:hypothetical protein
VSTCSHHRRRPAAPVRTPEDALTAISLATDAGHRDCVAVACLDAGRRPLAMFVLDGSDRAAGPTLLLQAVECLVAAAVDVGSPVDAVVLGLSRPGGCHEPTPDDLELFRRMEDLCVDGGILLLDWFVISDGDARSVAHCLGRPPAW